MISKVLLSLISKQATTAKALMDSAIPFGGMSVIVLGDFDQFPPIDDNAALYRKLSVPTSHRLTEYHNKAILGHNLWQQFTTVVILTQQMRQAEDRPYLYIKIQYNLFLIVYIYFELLQRIRHGTSTYEDFETLSSRIISSSSCISSKWQKAPIITSRNSVRCAVNPLQMLHYAKEQQQRPIIWEAVDYYKKKAITTPQIKTLLAGLPDSKTKLPHSFIYVKGATYILTVNKATELGLANGVEGKAVGIVLDSREQPDDGSGNAWHIKFPPHYVLFESDSFKVETLPGLPQNTVPITIQKQSFTTTVKMTGSKAQKISIS